MGAAFAFAFSFVFVFAFSYGFAFAIAFAFVFVFVFVFVVASVGQEEVSGNALYMNAKVYFQSAFPRKCTLAGLPPPKNFKSAFLILAQHPTPRPKKNPDANDLSSVPTKGFEVNLDCCLLFNCDIQGKGIVPGCLLPSALCLLRLAFAVCPLLLPLP